MKPATPKTQRCAIYTRVSTDGQAAEAHAVLAPALEGFSPTPEMPEIVEAQRFHK